MPKKPKFSDFYQPDEQQNKANSCLLALASLHFGYAAFWLRIKKYFLSLIYSINLNTVISSLAWGGFTFIWFGAKKIFFSTIATTIKEGKEAEETEKAEEAKKAGKAKKVE